MKTNRVVCKTSYEASIDPEELETLVRKHFAVPADAKLRFRIPGGGDWSNQTVDTATFDAIELRWEVVTEETDGD